MATITVNAESTTLVLNGFRFESFIAGDVMELTPVNPHSSHVVGSNNSVNINKRTDGNVRNLVMRVQRYSDEDIRLNSWLNSQSLVVINGSLKEDFSKDGVDGVESWILEGGSLTDQPTEVKNDQDGNALMEYTIMFRNAQRNL